MDDQAASSSSPPTSITILNKTYKPLGDGTYDAVFVSTGLKECILAGLLAVRGWRVLQIDRNAYYGGACASLNLEELFTHFKKPFESKALEGRFGQSRKYAVDLVPKFLLANGQIVKMLVQTGVTRYMDFNGVAGSYVVAQSMFSGAAIYKVPVTPSEALSSTLVGALQKRSLMNFATWLDKYHVTDRSGMEDLEALSALDFRTIVEEYYGLHNPEKKGEVGNLIEQYKSRPRAQLVSALEKKYGVPVFPVEVEVEFGAGPLGLRIDPKKLEGSVLVKSVVRVQGFQQNPDGTPGQGEKSGRIKPGDWISKINGESVLGLPDGGATKKLVEAPRPVKITFLRPPQLDSDSTPSSSEPDPKRMTMAQLYAHFGLDQNSQTFIGHAMALETSDDYVSKPAEPTVEKIQTYGRSVGRFGQSSPYIYPMFGLSSIPEGFSRLAGIHGGTVMLRTNPDEILTDESGKVVGVRVGEEAATARFVVGDASYFPSSKSKILKKVVRSICVVKHAVPNTNGEHSLQIIIPAKEVKGRVHDIYVSVVSNFHQVAPPNVYICICSTVVETTNPVQELQPAFNLVGAIEERFDAVVDVFGPSSDNDLALGMIVMSSLDETSHFETATEDILHKYRRIFGKPLDLNEKLVQSQQE